MASIHLQHIDKIYPGDVKAVSDLSLEIQDEEFVVLVGPSGCGKSTTLRMIAGLEEISGGEMRIGDRVVNQVPPKDRDIAMVFQNYALYPHMNVYGNMAFSLKLRKMPKAEIDQRIQNAAEILDIKHLLNRKPKALSGGQRQRVALGRAIVRDPAVFLLDEPLSNLDAKLRTSMRAEITKLHRQLKTTFVYVTHDQTEAMTMGDRIVVMKDGILQQVDTPENLYTSPCNLFVATFIGTPQMNLLPVTLEKINGQYAARYGEIILPIANKNIDQETLANFVGSDLIFGIRPENVHVKTEGSAVPFAAEASIDVRVDFVEMLGADLQIYARSGAEQLIATVPSHHKVRGERTLTLALDCARGHLFDPKTELAL